MIKDTGRKHTIAHILKIKSVFLTSYVLPPSLPFAVLSIPIYLSVYLGIIQILVSFGIVYYAATHGYRYVYDRRRYFCSPSLLQNNNKDMN